MSGLFTQILSTILWEFDYQAKSWDRPRRIIVQVRRKAGELVDRNFDEQPHSDVVIRDLTYVRVKNRWLYHCVLTTVASTLNIESHRPF